MQTYCPIYGFQYYFRTPESVRGHPTNWMSSHHQTLCLILYHQLPSTICVLEQLSNTAIYLCICKPAFIVHVLCLVTLTRRRLLDGKSGLARISSVARDFAQNRHDGAESCSFDFDCDCHFIWLNICDTHNYCYWVTENCANSCALSGWWKLAMALDAKNFRFRLWTE